MFEKIDSFFSLHQGSGTIISNQKLVLFCSCCWGQPLEGKGDQVNVFATELLIYFNDFTTEEVSNILLDRINQLLQNSAEFLYDNSKYLLLHSFVFFLYQKRLWHITPWCNRYLWHSLYTIHSDDHFNFLVKPWILCHFCGSNKQLDLLLRSKKNPSGHVKLLYARIKY